jgi:hypothetical protein
LNSFSIELNGFVSSRYSLLSDGGTDGASGNDLLVALPTVAASASFNSNGYYRAAGGSTQLLVALSTAGQSYVSFISGGALGGIPLLFFTNGDRGINFSIRYKAF